MSTNKKKDIASLINDLEVIKIFKDEDGEEEVSIMDFIN